MCPHARCTLLSFSHSTVSSMTMSFFPVLDHRTISGLKVVWTMSWKTSLLPRSTSMFHSIAPSKIYACCGVALVIVSPGFTKVLWCFGLLPRSIFLSFSSQSANYLRTAWCLHLYLPCVSDVEQDERTCSSVPDLSYRLWVIFKSPNGRGSLVMVWNSLEQFILVI